MDGGMVTKDVAAIDVRPSLARVPASGCKSRRPRARTAKVDEAPRSRSREVGCILSRLATWPWRIDENRCVH